MGIMDKLINASGGNVQAKKLLESAFFTDVEETELPSNIIALNIINSGSVNGGLTPGINILAGESGTGKTLTAWLNAKAFQEKFKDGVVLFYDCEFGCTLDYLNGLNVDVDRVLHIPIKNIEEFKFDLFKKLEAITSGDNVFILVDSLGNLASKKELDDAQKESSAADMSRAKAYKSFFRIITPMILEHKLYFCGINHTYMETGMFAKTIISGGSGIRYSANSAIIFTKSQEKDGTDLAGFNITLTVNKSRYVREKKRLAVKLMFDDGFLPYSGLFDLLVDSGLVTKSGTKYLVTDMETGEIGDKKYWQREIETDESIIKPLVHSEQFDEYVKSHFRLKKAKSLSDIDDELVLE